MENSYNILTFNEWKFDGVRVKPEAKGVHIFSLQEKKTFMRGDVTLRNKLNDSNYKEKLLLSLFQKHFDWIQEQYKYWKINNYNEE